MEKEARRQSRLPVGRTRRTQGGGRLEVPRQQLAQEMMIDVAVLLFEQHGRLAPAFERPGLAVGLGAKRPRDVELAAVVGPPALGNGVLRQSRRQTPPVLPDQ